jgi:hypothetical protein
MEPEIVNIREITMGDARDLRPEDVPEGLCQFDRSILLVKEGLFTIKIMVL